MTTRADRLIFTWTEARNRQIMQGSPIKAWELVSLVCAYTGITRKTAKGYIEQLRAGVKIDGTLYKLKLKGEQVEIWQ